MLEPTPAADQLTAARNDPLRVLIVGAGVAGVTLAQLLRRDGHHPVLVERADRDADHGYMLSLWPVVDPVLDALELTGQYAAHSTPVRRYRVRNRHGAPLREYPIGTLLDRFGDYRGISRGELLRVLGSAGCPVAYATTVTALDQRDDAVGVTLETGSGPVEAGFDLVVAADGMHSATRDLVLGPGEVTTYDTGWGGWVAWAETDSAHDLVEELWGAGFGVGTYPVADRVGVFLGGPRADTAVGPGRFAAHVRERVRASDARLDRALDAIDRAENPYYWSLTDRRARRWSTGRVVLLGDAAAGFLPTAGIGAGMAMESAGVLAAHLRGATPWQVPAAVHDYERRQRPRVESAQRNSRQLAPLMFRRSGLLAAARDTAVRFLSLQTALRSIRALLEDRPSIAPSVVTRARGVQSRS